MLLKLAARTLGTFIFVMLLQKGTIPDWFEMLDIATHLLDPTSHNEVLDHVTSGRRELMFAINLEKQGKSLKRTILIFTRLFISQILVLLL